MMGNREHKWDDHDAICRTCRRYVCMTRQHRRRAKRQSAKGSRRAGKREARSVD